MILKKNNKEIYEFFTSLMKKSELINEKHEDNYYTYYYMYNDVMFEEHVLTNITIFVCKSKNLICFDFND